MGRLLASLPVLLQKRPPNCLGEGLLMRTHLINVLLLVEGPRQKEARHGQPFLGEHHQVVAKTHRASAHKIQTTSVT